MEPLTSREIELLEALKATVKALNIAFEYDGDVFRRHHNDAVDALNNAEMLLAAHSTHKTEETA